MAEVKVSFSVTEKGNNITTWIDVNNKSVTLHNGKGDIKLSKGENFQLRWYFLGNPGDSISIEGKQGDEVIVTLKESKIPLGYDRHANNKAFETLNLD